MKTINPKAFSAARKVAAEQGVSGPVARRIIEAYLQRLKEKTISDEEIRSLLLAERFRNERGAYNYWDVGDVMEVIRPYLRLAE
jgi:hypothetical protein